MSLDINVLSKFYYQMKTFLKLLRKIMYVTMKDYFNCILQYK